MQAQEGTETRRQMKGQGPGAASSGCGRGVTADEEGDLTAKSLTHQGHTQKPKYAYPQHNSRFRRAQVIDLQAHVDAPTTIMQDCNRAFTVNRESKNMSI